MKPFSIEPFTILTVYCRHILDAFGIYGSGLFIMGQQIKFKELLKISFFAALLMTPVRFLPMGMGIQVDILFLIMIIFLMNIEKFSILTVSGTVLLGGWLLVALEWFYSFLMGGLNLQPPVPYSLLSILYTIPSTLTLILLAFVFQFWFKSKHIRPQIDDSSSIEDTYRMDFLKFIPVAQLFTTFLIYMTFAVTPFYRQVPEWIIRLSPIFIFALILISYYDCKKWSQGEEFSLPIGSIDLIILIPLIYFALISSGGTASIFKFLFIPLILTNTLKPSNIYGVLALIGSGFCLFILGFQAKAAGRAWNIEIDIIFLVTFLLIYWFVKYFSTMEASLREKILNKALTDELTGLFNSRFLHQVLDEKKKTFLLVIDLDNFKLINDKLGHLAGDRLLKKIASSLKKATRDSDFVIRYGGDEFMVIPDENTGREQVFALAERIRDVVEEICDYFVSEYSDEFEEEGVTASIGIASRIDFSSTVEDLIGQADEALYRAKARGKNCTIFYS